MQIKACEVHNHELLFGVFIEVIVISGIRAEALATIYCRLGLPRCTERFITHFEVNRCRFTMGGMGTFTGRGKGVSSRRGS